MRGGTWLGSRSGRGNLRGRSHGHDARYSEGDLAPIQVDALHSTPHENGWAVYENVEGGGFVEGM